MLSQSSSAVLIGCRDWSPNPWSQRKDDSLQSVPVPVPVRAQALVQAQV
jgi:hypothetical protein